MDRLLGDLRVLGMIAVDTERCIDYGPADIGGTVRLVFVHAARTAKEPSTGFAKPCGGITDDRYWQNPGLSQLAL